VKKRILLIGGKVHDVGYRPFLLGLAESLEINRFFADNTFVKDKQGVEILIDDEEDKIKAFIDIIGRKYPENAVFDKIEQKDYEGRVMSAESYFRYLNALQLSRIATYGGGMLEKQDSMLEKQDSMLEKQDSMLEKQDSMLEKQDSMLEKQDSMLEKQDSMLEKQDETISAIREESGKTRETVRVESRNTREGIVDALERGFDGLKDEHVKTREFSKEIFYTEVQELRQELQDLRVAVEEIKKRVGI
jgi:acylphosphatase